MSVPLAHRELIRAAFGDRELNLAPLGGGLRNRSYRVTGPGIDYAVRLPATEASDFRLDPVTEQRLLTCLAAHGLSPSAYPMPRESGLVATRFVANARVWSSADARLTRNIDRLVERLRMLHRLDIVLAPYACVAAAERYVSAAVRRRDANRELRRWADELRVLALAFEAKFHGAAPCHNDLVASNVLDDGRLWLVDFEYAAASSPLLDLAGLAGLNGFDDTSKGYLVTAYYGEEEPPFDADEFDAAVRLVRLLALFWILADDPRSEGQPQTAAFAAALEAVLR